MRRPARTTRWSSARTIVIGARPVAGSSPRETVASLTSGFQPGSRIDLAGLVLVKLHRASDHAPRAERHITAHDQPLRLSQRRRPIGKALLEPVEQLVEALVEL